MSKTYEVSNYWTLLQDPRWQKIRLEVMQRAGFACEECEDSDSTLHVHHCYYEKGLKPWEYPIDSLRCVCKPCHEKLQQFYIDIKRALAGIKGNSTHALLGYAHGCRSQYNTIVLGETECLVVDRDNTAYLSGLANAFGITRTQLEKNLLFDSTSNEWIVQSSVLDKLRIVDRTFKDGGGI